MLAALAIFVIGRMLLSAHRELGDERHAPRRPRRHVEPFLEQLALHGAAGLRRADGVHRRSACRRPTSSRSWALPASRSALALKDSLSNFSSGVMLVFFRPFKVGDQIDAAGVSGVVDSVGIFSVVLKTPGQPRHQRAEQPRLRRHDHELQRREHAAHRSPDSDRLRRRHSAGEAVIAAIVAAEARIAEAPAPEVAVQDVLHDDRDARRARLGRRPPTTATCAATCSSASSARSTSTACRFRLEQRVLPVGKPRGTPSEGVAAHSSSRSWSSGTKRSPGCSVTRPRSRTRIGSASCRRNTRASTPSRAISTSIASSSAIIAAAAELRASADPDMRALAEDEHKELVGRRAALERQLLLHLVPKDPDDDANLFLEVRAGTGGDEAAIFAGDLFRMYSRYAERQGWTRRGVERESAASTAAIAKSSRASRARARTRSSSSSPACIACSACRRPRRKAAFTPPRARWPCSRSPRTSARSRSTRPTSRSTPIARRAPAAST